MTRDDHHDLAALWSAAAPIADQRELARLALHIPRRARLVQWGEIGAGIVLALIIVLAIVLHLGLASILIGSLILALLGWSAWRRHHLANVAMMMLDERDGLSFVGSLLRAKEAEHNRSALGLALVLPGTLMTILLGFALNGGQEGELAAFFGTILTTPRGLVTFSFLFCALVLLVLAHIRLSAEVTALRELKQDYESEARKDQLSEL